MKVSMEVKREVIYGLRPHMNMSLLPRMSRDDQHWSQVKFEVKYLKNGTRLRDTGSDNGS